MIITLMCSWFRQVKEQGTAGLAEWQVAQLIENDQVHAQPQGNPPGFASSLLQFQGIDQVDRREEAHAFAVMRNARNAQRRSEVRLAGCLCRQ
ncbi:hypothetical protein MASR1M42_22550 [Azonexus hydrophilus]